MTATRAPLVLAALAVLLAAASAISAVVAGDVVRPAAQLGLGILAALAGLSLAGRVAVGRLAAPVTLAAAGLTALLFLSPLGSPELGAYRSVDLGIPVQPAPFWVLAAQLAAVAVTEGQTRSRLWLALALAGCLGSAFAMRELSVIPQTAAAAFVVAWSCGQRALALVALGTAGAVVAMSAQLPYVRRRWVGWLDPDGHAQGAGWDYQALRATLAGSRWVGPADAQLPRFSSPFADYWLASAMWRLGRLPALGWVLALVGTLLAATRPGQEPRPDSGLLLTRAVAAGMLASLAIHVAYNVGLVPVTAVDPPLAGPGVAAVALHVFALGFGLASCGRLSGGR